MVSSRTIRVDVRVIAATNRAVLKTTGGVVKGPKGAASVLGLHPNTLRSRMKKLGISAAVACALSILSG